MINDAGKHGVKTGRRPELLNGSEQSQLKAATVKAQA